MCEFHWRYWDLQAHWFEEHLGDRHIDFGQILKINVESSIWLQQDGWGCVTHLCKYTPQTEKPCTKHKFADMWWISKKVFLCLFKEVEKVWKTKMIKTITYLLLLKSTHCHTLKPPAVDKRYFHIALCQIFSWHLTKYEAVIVISVITKLWKGCLMIETFSFV